jgi:hypothetical protein
MCQERSLEEKVCRLQRENERLQERNEELTKQNTELLLELNKKQPTILIEGREVTVID